MQMFVRFNKVFWRTIWHVRTVILALLALVVVNAVPIALIEKMPFGDALYFAFVTGLTIGYGDIVMQTPVGRLIALLIAVVGILISGMIVAAAVHAVRESMEKS
jgi:voltage-gated potassium channel Kch